jgi:2-alkenal reductase
VSEPGDVITAVEGKPIESVADLATALEQAGVGNEVTLTVKRGDAERQVKVKVVDLQS